MDSIKRFLSRNANNYRGWKTDRKIVVIESDDWGSICMPSQSTYSKLTERGYRVDQCAYASYDSLAGHQDFSELFSVLKKFKDCRGNHPVITANTLVANPDFEKIEENNFKKYFYEPFTVTLKRYPNSSHENSFQYWKEGISQNIFFPQFHGREHINIKIWLSLLEDSDSIYKSVFDDSICWLGPSYNSNRGSLRAAFETDQLSDLDIHSEIIKQGLYLFEDIFGYQSKSFVAPNYVLHSDLYEILIRNGVNYLQGMKYGIMPKLGGEKNELKRRIQGENTNSQLVNLVRNCEFEPSQYSQSYDSVGECLKGINNAFFWQKPAIISAHRLNFIGHVHPDNRKQNLKLFKELLNRIIRNWPNVEFMTSVDLGDIISCR